MTSLKSPKIDTAKNEPYYTSSFRVLEKAKLIRTRWKFNTPSKRHFHQNFPTQKIPDIQSNVSIPRAGIILTVSWYSSRPPVGTAGLGRSARSRGSSPPGSAYGPNTSSPLSPPEIIHSSGIIIIYTVMVKIFAWGWFSHISLSCICENITLFTWKQEFGIAKIISVGNVLPTILGPPFIMVIPRGCTFRSCLGYRGQL